MNKLQQQISIIDSVTGINKADKGESEDTSLQDHKHAIKEGLSVVKDWLNRDLKDSDPEVLLHDITDIIQTLEELCKNQAV